MLILLSPSKTLNADPSRPRKAFSKPEHLDRSQELMQLLRRLSNKQLRALMGISEKLASQVEGYVKKWKTPFTDKNSAPAVLTSSRGWAEPTSARARCAAVSRLCQPGGGGPALPFLPASEAPPLRRREHCTSLLAHARTHTSAKHRRKGAG